MLSKIVIFSMCIAAAVGFSAVFRLKRSPGGGAVSSSYSSSSSSSSGGGGGGGNFFRFPAPMPIPTVGFPAFGMNNAFQRFVETANAAHVAASQDPIFEKIYQQQLAILANLQQMAWTQYPFAFPGFDVPNTVGGGVGTWSNGLGTRTGSSGSDPAVFTSGAVSFGSPGGVGVVSSFPGGPDGLGTRISEEFPAPSGSGTYGTFSSSSSGVSNINGETKSFKTSTIGVNDNGKITFRTV